MTRERRRDDGDGGLVYAQARTTPVGSVTVLSR